jgi:tetratricopeptide (TPR) repeat protein
MDVVRSSGAVAHVCPLCGVWVEGLERAHAPCASSDMLPCPRCDALLASELVAPTKVVFRCPAAHGTFVPYASLDAVTDLDWAAMHITVPQPGDVDPEKVFEAFKEKIRSTIDPRDARAHYDLAQAYREMGLLADALEMIDKVLALEPSWPNAAFMRAELIEALRKR